MSLLQPLDTEQKYLKAAFYGEEKSGKTFTGTELLCHVYKRFGCTGPIAAWDSENGTSYRAKRIKDLTGAQLVGKRARDLDSLIAVIQECVKEGIQCLLVDSITDALEEARVTYERKIGRALEMRDYGVADARMRKFCDVYLNAPIHIVVCGKLGKKYEKNDRGKMEAAGNKLKGGPFGYLARLLVEMEAVKLGNGKIVHRASIAGDCYDALKAGAVFDNPAASAFDPVLDALVPTAAQPETDLQGESDFSAEADVQERDVLIEEIKAECEKRWPTPAKSKGKPEALQACFGFEASARIVKECETQALREGLEKLRGMPA